MFIPVSIILERNFFSISLSDSEVELYREFQKEFNSKAQKARRFIHDIQSSVIKTGNVGKAILNGRATNRDLLQNSLTPIHRSINMKSLGVLQPKQAIKYVRNIK